MAWKIYFFQTARGDCPVKEFIENQDKITYAKILWLIELLENYGPYLRFPYVKKLQGGLCELRISGKISVRIFFTRVGREYYLLHAFKKKSQKIPPKELQTALDRMREII